MRQGWATWADQGLTGRALRYEGLWILAAACCVFFLNLGGIALWDEDEPKNAVCAREMLNRGDWIVPTFNGQLRTDKPILLYWLMLGAYQLFGVTEFAARFASSALATVTVILTWDLGRRLGPPRAGLWSGLALCSCLMFAVSARAATPDATLIACTTFALWVFARSQLSREESPVDNSMRVPAAAISPLTTTTLLGVYGGLGLATLAKGPSGFVLPLGILLVFQVLRCVRQPGDAEGAAPVSLWRRLLTAGVRAVRTLRLAPGMAVCLAVALPWYLIVGQATNWAWPLGFLGRHNVQRFLGPLEGHGGPVVYYLPAILIGLAPWSLWLPAALQLVWRRARSETGLPLADLFLVTWIGIYLLVFSLAGTKLPSYVLPCYPALALLVGRYLAARPLTHPGPFVILACLGGLLSLAIVLGSRWLVDSLLPWSTLGLIPLAGSLLGGWLLRRRLAEQALGAFAVSTVLLLAGVLGLAADSIDDNQTHVAFARWLKATRTGASPVATLDAFRPTLVYYAGGTITDCATPQEAGRFLNASPDAVLVTRDDQWSTLQPLLPPDARVLTRRRMFLRDYDLLLIGRTAPRHISFNPDDRLPRR